MTHREAVLLAAHLQPEMRLAITRERFLLPTDGHSSADEEEVDELDESALEPADAADDETPVPTTAERIPFGADQWNDMAAEVLPKPAIRGIQLREGGDVPTSLALTYGEVTESCLDGIALAGRHRTLLPWVGRAREEERALAFIDALVVTPRFPTALFSWWDAAAELTDPWKIWAPIIVLTCLEGDDVPLAFHSILGKLTEESDEAAVIASEALLLGPRRDRLDWVTSLARDPSPPLRAVSLEARSLANTLSASELIGVFSTDAARIVRWTAARAAARFPADSHIDELLLSELHRASDAEWAWEVVRALAVRGLPAGYFAMKHDPGLAVRLGPRVLDVLALFGDASDAALARQVASRLGLTSKVIRGLGRYGHPGAAPLLLRALSDEDAAEEASLSLTWLFGLPMDERKALSPEVWRTWLATADLNETTRYRFGKPYSTACVSEAASEGLRSKAELAWMVDEANVRAGLLERPELWRWSPAADQSLAPSLGAFSRAAEPFVTDSWRSVGRERRRRA